MSYTFYIVLALIGFFILAVLLLVPVYRFLRREEEAAAKWTQEALRRENAERPPSSDGSTEGE